MANWNDDRLDKRDEEVKAGFVRLERQIVANRREMLGGVLAIVVALIGVLGAGLA